MDQNSKENRINNELITITKGAGFSFFGTVFSKGVKFIIVILITRILGVGLFGIYSLGLTIVNFVSKFSCFGLNQGSLKYIPVFLNQGDKKRTKGFILTAVTISLVAGVIAGFLLFFYSQEIANFFNKPKLFQTLKFFSIAIPFLTLLSVLSASTRGFKTTKYHIIGSIIVPNFVQLVFILLFYLLGYKLLGMIWAYIFALIAGCLVLFYYLRKLFPDLASKKIKPKFETKKFLSTSFPLMYVTILVSLISWTDILMIGYFLSSAEVGTYKVVITIAALIMIFLSSFISIFSPIISEYYHRDNLKQLNEILKTVAKWVLILSFPIFLSILVSPKEILGVFDINFLKGGTSLLILSCAQVFNVLTFAVRSSLSMTSYQNLDARLSTIVVILNIILNYVFIVIFNMGITGAALATAISLFLMNGFSLFFVYIKLHLNPISSKTFLIIFLAIFSIIPSLFIKYQFFENFHYFINLILSSLFVILIFSSTVLIFGIEKKDKFILKKIMNRIKK